MDGIASVYLIDIDREVVLIVADALPFAHTVLVYQLTVYGVCLACAGHMLVVIFTPISLTPGRISRFMS
jgi:hypothetical protein